MYLDGTTVKYEAFSDGRRFTYMYDAMGQLYAVRLATYSNPTASAIYYYVYNLQGDVIALINSANGQIVARYEYDAWGKPVAITDANGNAITDQSHIAHVNPFRYRGYYYDYETGLYYLNSRYYDPETGRFVNADSYIGSTAGMNLFGYCLNNPILYKDSTGQSFLAAIAGTIVQAAAVALAATVIVGIFAVYGEDIIETTVETGVAIITIPIEVILAIEQYARKKNAPPKKEISFLPPSKYTPPRQQTSTKDDNKNNDNYYYFMVFRDPVANVIIIGDGMHYGEALIYFMNGGNVMALNHVFAADLACGAGVNPYSAEIDKNKENIPGYYYHYHLYDKHGDPHLWFYGNKMF